MFNIPDGLRADDIVAAARLTNPGAVGSSTTPGMAKFCVFSVLTPTTERADFSPSIHKRMFAQ